MTAEVRRFLADLDAAHQAATPGPWGLDLDRTGGYDLTDEDGQFIADRLGALDEDNARLIVAAVNSLPALISALRAVLDLADELEKDAEAFASNADQLRGVGRSAAVATSLTCGGIAKQLTALLSPLTAPTPQPRSGLW